MQKHDDNTTPPPPQFVPVEEEMRQLRGEVAHLRERNEAMAHQITQLKKIVFGSKSERTSLLQDVPVEQGALFTVPAVENPIEPDAAAPVEAPTQDPSAKAAPATDAKPDKKRSGRRPVPAHFEEQELVIEAPPEHRVNAQGHPLALLGYETSERLNRIPARFVRQTIKREKWGKPDTHELVYTAPPLNAIVPKGKLGDGLIGHVIFQKYFMAVPLYRQLQEYNAMGAELSKAILSDAVHRFAELFAPVAAAIRAEVFAGKYVQADETPIKCQGLKTGPMRKTYLWAVRNRDACYFHHGTRGGKEVRVLFDFSKGPVPVNSPKWHAEKKQWTGYLLTDAYDVYNQAEGIVHIGCWAHVRRKFFELAEHDAEAKWFLAEINLLYDVERTVTERRDQLAATPEAWSDERFFAEKTAARQTCSKPVVEKLEARVKALMQARALTPASALGKAVSYLANNLKRLKPFLDDGELPIDNNAVEQSIRPPVIGRKNYLFVGSEDAGGWAAVCYSLMESCRLMRVDPQQYLAVATPRLLAGEAPATLTPRALADQIRDLPRNF
ncbi:MAG: IS66 family transposase [Rhodanobacteraceae bacterium]